MDKNSADEFMSTMFKIAKRHKITLIDISLEENQPYIKANGIDYYKDRSFSAGTDYIELGLFENPRLKLLSFFHELGHCLPPVHPIRGEGKSWKYVQEFEAWRKGLNCAAEEGIFFTEEELHWAMQQLETYYHWEEKEVDGWKGEAYYEGLPIIETEDDLPEGRDDCSEIKQSFQGSQGSFRKRE